MKGAACLQRQRPRQRASGLAHAGIDGRQEEQAQVGDDEAAFLAQFGEGRGALRVVPCQSVTKMHGGGEQRRAHRDTPPGTSSDTISEPKSFMKMLPRLLYVEMVKGAGGSLLMMAARSCAGRSTSDGAALGKCV